MQFCIQSNVDIWEIVLCLQANPYRLKTKNIKSFAFLRKKRKRVVVYLCMSPHSCCLK